MCQLTGIMYVMIVVGVDEVGRGSWAGPLLVVAAYSIAKLPEGLKDSKLLSKNRRENLIEDIKNSCQLGEGWVQPEEIDEHGLAKALRIGVARALLALSPPKSAKIIIDGNVNYCPAEFTNSECLIDGDKLVPIISAASIYAKVLRDAHMTRLAQIYPLYEFEQHVGYGTRRHQLMLKVHGPSKIHRRSFKPVAKLIG